MSTKNDSYTTIGAAERREAKVQRSRFIADGVPVTGREEVEAFLAHVRKEFFDAAHHCYAYRLGIDGSLVRVHDDGEPHGSAGKPILAAIDGAGLTNLVVVVTRYFGGIKLGVGGLSRAYGGAAATVLAAAPKVIGYSRESFNISFPHIHIGNVMRVVNQVGARIVETRYGEEINMRLEIRAGRAGELRSILIDHTSGKIRFTGNVVPHGS